MDWTGRKLLLVDDEPDILETVQTLMEVEFPGVAVQVAMTGEAAMVELRKARYDLMVTDYRMPGMDGATLANEAAKGWPGMGILMITAYIDAKTTQDIKDRAPNLEVLPKPLEIDVFVERVRGKLGGQAGTGASADRKTAHD